MRYRAVFLAAVCAAAVCAAQVAARIPERPKPRTIPAVTVLPYVAPWQSEFERYSTQFVDPTRPATTHFKWTVPDGQWWRIVSLAAELFTDAVAGNRTPFMQISTPGAGVRLTQSTPLAVAASKAAELTWAPGQAAFANTSGGTPVFGTAPIPDVLWPPGAVVDLFVGGAVDPGDAFQAVNTTLGVEVYTPAKDRAGVLVPAPLIP